MCEVVSVNCDNDIGDQVPVEFASLNPAHQQCDEPMPPYKEIKPTYDGLFTERFRQIDAVRYCTLIHSNNSFSPPCRIQVHIASREMKFSKQSTCRFEVSK